MYKKCQMTPRVVDGLRKCNETRFEQYRLYLNCIQMRRILLTFTFHMLHTSKHHLQNNISQRQVKLKRDSIQHFSRLNKGFAHAFTKNTCWGVDSSPLEAQILEKN